MCWPDSDEMCIRVNSAYIGLKSITDLSISIGKSFRTYFTCQQYTKGPYIGLVRVEETMW